MPTMYILRGPPGSTKSTTVQNLIREIEEDHFGKAYRNPIVISADHYWERPDGRYEWVAASSKYAHAWAQSECREACINGYSDVIIDNTNIKLKEMAPYEALAAQFGYEVKYIASAPPWGWSAQACFEKCTHGVPLEVIQRMIDTYEPRPGEVDPRSPVFSSGDRSIDPWTEADISKLEKALDKVLSEAA